MCNLDQCRPRQNSFGTNLSELTSALLINSKQVIPFQNFDGDFLLQYAMSNPYNGYPISQKIHITTEDIIFGLKIDLFSPDMLLESSGLKRFFNF